MTYSIAIARTAQKSLARVASPHQDRIIQAIAALAENPRPAQVKKLTGRDVWRIRVGDYRVIYEIHGIELRVMVIVIGYRKDIYRR